MNFGQLIRDCVAIGIGKSSAINPKTLPFNKDMWMAFSGAEEWSDGPPVYREFPKYLVIASAAGIECHVQSDYPDPVWSRLDVEFPTQKGAVTFLDALPVDFDPEEYGFE
jgi:hypothetical protein